LTLAYRQPLASPATLDCISDGDVPLLFLAAWLPS